MQVGTLAIAHLFEKDVLYHVPLYQRPYVWNAEDQWEPLWGDIQRLAERLRSGGDPRAHFLGASVQDRPSAPPGQIETRVLIDGQQRMTTIQVMLKAFMDVLGGIGNDRYYKALRKLVYNDHPLSTKNYEQFKVWPTNSDRADFEKLMETDDPANLLREYGKRSDARQIGRELPDAYLFFFRAVKEWLGEPEGGDQDQRVSALYSAIRENVRLVVIDLDEKDDAQLIFETLNARGTPLLAADLVKNSILNEVQADNGSAEEAYRRYWQGFDDESAFWRTEIGKGHARRARIEVFLQHVMTLLTREEVTAGHLYAAYRDFAEKGESGSPVERLRAFSKYGSIYRGMQDGHDNDGIQIFLDRIHTMDVGTAYPLLLKLFDIIGDREDVLLSVLTDIESFLVRRMVCRLSTRGYNRVFLHLLESIPESGEGVAAAVRSELLSGKAEVDRWPTDAEFYKAWIENPLYQNLTRPRLRLILEALEIELRSEFAEERQVPKGLTVEHVMPQGWRGRWPLPEDLNEAEAVGRREECLHTIGNLTLLKGKFNSYQSNKPWKDDEETSGKREELSAHSLLYLNKQLCDFEDWSEETIRERSEDLFSQAKSIWPGP